MYVFTRRVPTMGFMSDIQDMNGKKIVVLGYARQGRALAEYATQHGANVVVSDLRDAETLQAVMDEYQHPNLSFVLGEHPLSLLDGADMLAPSGGVPLTIPIVEAAKERGIQLSNDSQEFALRCPCPLIGITGSAGKSTTTTLVGEILKASGLTTHVGGNLGYPLLTELPKIKAKDRAVQELSSFQLELWTASPHIAAILNITPNHLDRHNTMSAYTEAKANILRFQKEDDVAILPSDSLYELQTMVRGRLRRFGQYAVEDGAFLRGNQLVLRDGVGESVVCTTAEIKLLGAHNVLNVLAAMVIADSAGATVDAMRETIIGFTGIAHRLEHVGWLDGVQYVNDSIATAPERSLAAIRAFSEPLVLLAGGKDKDLAWEEWIDVVESRVKVVVLFGHLGEQLRDQLDSRKVTIVRTNTLERAVTAARLLSDEGDVVLLSPAGTSYDAYQDFAERGKHFRKIIKAEVLK